MENINEHDMTKKMLGKIRMMDSKNPSLNENVNYIQPTNTQPEQLDEHDMTKKMLGKIRTSQAIKETKSVVGGLLTEGYDNHDVNDVIEVDSSEWEEEKKTLTHMIGGVTIKLYEVYPKNNNVVMVGVLQNGIEFKYSYNEGAPYINVENVKLDDETVKTINRLESYYTNWVKDWDDKIGEYAQGS